MSTLTLAYPYYRNSTMLAEQYRVWQGYSDTVKAQIECVIVDDGSPEPAADVTRPSGLPPLRIYRVQEDRPWHQHGARNLAATEAQSPWLFLSDMDHVLPGSCARLLLDRLERHALYTFHRLDAPDLKPKTLNGNLHPHQNTFAVRKERFWQAGGYNEALCGFYGTDGYFIRSVMNLGPVIHLDHVHVVRYPRDVIRDASTRAPDGMDPKAFRDSARRMSERGAILSQPPVAPVQFAWERVV